MAEKYRLTQDKILYMMESLKGPMGENFVRAERALHYQKFDDFTGALHSIKGALLNLGLIDWADFARYLEILAKNGELADYGAFGEAA